MHPSVHDLNFYPTGEVRQSIFKVPTIPLSQIISKSLLIITFTLHSTLLTSIIKIWSINNVTTSTTLY